ncbi:MAG: oligosaccharide flippase family protein [Clostridiales bacterium]|nr:oligosaccharide flippase family protein [Clostridiales bacterium]
MIQQILRANVILVIQFSVRSLVPLLLVPHIVKTIGLTEYGYLAVVMAWGNYGAGIVRYAFNLTGPKRIATLTEKEKATTVFFDIALAKLFLLIAVSIILGILLFFLLPLKSSGSITCLLLFALPIAAAFDSTWFLQVEDKFATICIIAIVGSLATLFVGFFLINKKNSFSVDVTVVVNMLSPLIIGLGTMVLSAKLLGNIRQFTWQFCRIVNELKEGWHLFISQFISMFYTASGPIIIDYFINAKAAGAYSVTMRIINALMAAVLLTHTAAYPRLASTFIADRAAYWRILKFIIVLYLIGALGIIFLSTLMNNYIVEFIYGEIQHSHKILFNWGLAWLALGVFGPALTGYLTVSGQGYKVWPLTLKILVTSLIIGVPAIFFWGSAGWLAGLVAAQLINLCEGYKYWRIENEKPTSSI